MMMTEDRERLAMEMGTDEDFPSAWSGWHWSGKIVAMCICLEGNLWPCTSTYTLLPKELKQPP
jgi:hypothetical protein